MSNSTNPRNDKLRIAILSIAVGQEWNELKKITFANKGEYSDRWDYDFHYSEVTLDESRPIAWSKILLIEKYLPLYDWIFWSDADSLIMNFTISLDSFVSELTTQHDEKIIIGEDYNGINSGSFFIRNDEWSFNIINSIYQHIPFTNHPWWENAAFHYLYHGVVDMIIGSKNFAAKYMCENLDNKKHFKVVSQRLFNSYPDNFADGDFIIHMPGMSNSERVKMMEEEYIHKIMR
jgi:galactosyl transferase GMA12/MNN10 family